MAFNLSQCLITNKSSQNKQYTLYRKAFQINDFEKAEMNVFANGIFKVYLNGLPVLKSGFLKEPEALSFNKVDITDYLMLGENVLAVIVYCEASTLLPPCCLGLQISADGKQILKSDNTFLTAIHSGFAQNGCYDSRSPETEFEYPDYDDSYWESAENVLADNVISQNTALSIDESPIKPKAIKNNGKTITAHFGKVYNGCLYVEANGKSGDEITLELSNQNSYRWILSGGYDTLCMLIPNALDSVKIHLKNNSSVDTESITLLVQK